MIRVAVSKRNAVEDTQQLLKEHYLLSDEHPEALRLPRPLAYLYYIAGSVTESCQGRVLKDFQTLDQVKSGMEGVGRALAAWHRVATPTKANSKKRSPRIRRSCRTTHRKRVAKVMKKVTDLLRPCEKASVQLLQGVRLHDVVLQKGRVGVQSAAYDDLRHDVANMIAAWEIQGVIGDEVERCAEAAAAFICGYGKVHTEKPEGIAAFEALALAERVYDLPIDTNCMKPLLSLAEA